MVTNEALEMRRTVTNFDHHIMLDVGCVLDAVAVDRGWVRGSRVVEARRPSFCCCTRCDNGHEACPDQNKHEYRCRIVRERRGLHDDAQTAEYKGRGSGGKVRV